MRSATPARNPCSTTSASAIELVGDRQALGRAEVDADALLAGHHLRAAGLGERHDHPDRVALERLDLDDPRAEVGEQRRAVRRGELGGELDDRHAGQRQAACGSPSVGGRRRRRQTRATARASSSSTSAWSRPSVGADVGGSAAVTLIIASGPGLAHRAALVVDDLGRRAVPEHLGVLEHRGAGPELLGEHVGVPVEHLVPLRRACAGWRARASSTTARSGVRGSANTGMPCHSGSVNIQSSPSSLDQGDEQPRRGLRELQPVTVLGQGDQEEVGERRGRDLVRVVVGHARVRAGPLLLDDCSNHDQVSSDENPWARLASTRWPSPLCSRSSSAASVPCSAVCDAANEHHGTLT